MANLGTIATDSRAKASNQGPRATMHYIHCGHVSQSLGAKDASVGNSAPSLRLDARGTFRLRWVVGSGSRTIAIDVKQEVNLSPRPTLVVLANADIGVSETTGTAGSGTGFVTIGPVTITPSGAGAVWVELRNNYDAGPMGTPCYFDNLAVT